MTHEEHSPVNVIVADHLDAAHQTRGATAPAPTLVMFDTSQNMFTSFSISWLRTTIDVKDALNGNSLFTGLDFWLALLSPISASGRYCDGDVMGISGREPGRFFGFPMSNHGSVAPFELHNPFHPSSAPTDHGTLGTYSVSVPEPSTTADTAIRLGRYFGNRAQFWLDLQRQYDIALIERDRRNGRQRRIDCWLREPARGV